MSSMDVSQIPPRRGGLFPRTRLALALGWLALAGMEAARGEHCLQTLRIELNNDRIEVRWDGSGVLQQAGSPESGWEDVLDATSPHRAPVGLGRAFYRLAYRPAFPEQALLFFYNASDGSAAIG